MSDELDADIMAHVLDRDWPETAAVALQKIMRLGNLLNLLETCELGKSEHATLSIRELFNAVHLLHLRLQRRAEDFGLEGGRKLKPKKTKKR